MNIDLLTDFAEKNQIKMLLNERLSEHTSFRIGGEAKAFFEPESKEEASKIIKLCHENNISILPIGKGSNLLVSDDGFDGVIISFGSKMSTVELVDENIIYCDSGVSLAKLCNFALEKGLTGLEFAYGIPGSVGGAVYMNAGAYGGEIKNVLIRSEHITDDGVLGSYEGEELQMSYRHSIYSDKDYFITGAFFKLEKGEKNEIKAKMDELLGKRFEKQPMELPSAGSTFKRPEGAFASELIDRCGLKGYTVGGAQVSTKHAGFVVNIGGATCKDVLKLMDDVTKTVKEKTGFVLEPEVKIIV